MLTSTTADSSKNASIAGTTLSDSIFLGRLRFNVSLAERNRSETLCAL